METESKLKPTSLDYALAALSPGLIILMIGSLVCFLLCTLYQGEFPARLMWILGLFTFASVLISRIAIEQSRAQSLVYLGLLGGATLFVAPRFFVVDGPMASFSLPILVTLLCLIAYLADRITMDATSVDDASESNGEGLLQSLGLLKRANANANAKQGKRKHNPGVWILYFALLAIPVFGLGQLFIQAAPARKLAFVCMIAYLFSALALLVVISLLSLRKYVRQRGVEMESSLSAKWLTAGISSTLGLIVLMAILPFPMLSSNMMELPFRITSRTDLSSSRWGWGNEGAGNAGQQGDSQDHPAVQQKPAPNQQPPKNQSSNGQEVQPQSGNGNAGSNSKDSGSSDGSSSDQANSPSADNQGTDPKSNNTNSNGSNPNGSSPGGTGATGPGSSNLNKNSSSSGQKNSGENSSGEESSNSRKPSSASDQQKNRSGQESRNEPQSSSGQPSSERDASNPAPSNSRNTADNNRSDNNTDNNSQDPNRGQQTERNAESNPRNQPEARDTPKPQPANPQPDQNRNRDPRNANQLNKPPEPQRDPPQSKGFSMEWNLGATFRWLILAGLLFVTLFYGIRYRQQIMLALRDFFQRWLGWFSGGPDEDTGPDTPSPSEPTIQQVLFSSFPDPFRESPSDPNKIVRRLFVATVAWASEHRVRRRDDETPEEFLRRLGRKYSEIQDPLLQLGMLYSRLAYAQKSVAMNDARSLRPMWDWLVAHATQPPSVPTPQSEAAILSADRS